MESTLRCKQIILYIGNVIYVFRSLTDWRRLSDTTALLTWTFWQAYIFLLLSFCVANRECHCHVYNERCPICKKLIHYPTGGSTKRYLINKNTAKNGLEIVARLTRAVGFVYGCLYLGNPVGNPSMFRRFTIPKVLYSEGPVFRRSYVPKLRGSMFRRFYVPKVLCSEGSMFRRFYVPKVLCSEKKSKVLFRRFYIQKVLCSEKLEGSIFRRFYVPKFQIVHPIESAWGVGTKTRVVDGHMHTGLNPFYRANHVFPEWHHNYVGSIIMCGCVENKLGVITEYLVSLWFHIHHHLPYSTGHFQRIAYRALRQFPINQYPMNIVSNRASALMPPPPPHPSRVQCNISSLIM